jgi:hypothetical protein
MHYVGRHEEACGNECTYSSTIHGLCTDGGEWSASGTDRSTSRERAPDTHWIIDWVGPRTGLNAEEYRTIFCHRPE